MLMNYYRQENDQNRLYSIASVSNRHHAEWLWATTTSGAHQLGICSSFWLGRYICLFPSDCCIEVHNKSRFQSVYTVAAYL